MLDDDIADAMSKEIAEEIDFEIISDILVKSCGWIRVTKNPTSKEHAASMAKWCDEQCNNRARYRVTTWLFERAEDAALFRLTWGS